MKSGLLVFGVILSILVLGVSLSQASYHLTAGVGAGADVNAGTGGASINSQTSANANASMGNNSADANMSADANATVEAGAEVTSYLRGLALERKRMLLDKLNTRFGLNLTIEDLDRPRIRAAVREAILEDIRINRNNASGMAGNNTVATLRADMRAAFMSNLSLFVQNMTLLQKQETVARINSRYGLNLTVNDLSNHTIRKEIRDLIEMDLRAQLSAMREERREAMGTGLAALVKQRGWVNIEGRNITVRELTGEEKELIVGRINAKYNVNITADDLEGNVTNLKARLSNGNNASIKVMPDRASQVALTRLRAKCAERNCTVILKEVGNGNQTRLAYEVKTEKDARFLLLFKRKMMVQAKVDAETGEVIEARKPWWAFLASEEDASEAEIQQEVQTQANAQASTQ